MVDALVLKTNLVKGTGWSSIIRQIYKYVFILRCNGNIVGLGLIVGS